MGLLFYVTYTFAFVFGTEQAAQRAEVEGSYLSPFSCMFRVDCGIHGSEVMVCIYGVILTAQFIALMNPGTLWQIFSVAIVRPLISLCTQTLI